MAEDLEITHRAIFEKLVVIDERSIASDGKLAVLEQRSIARDDELSDIKASVGEMATTVGDMAELLEAWNAVQVGSKFLKWLAGLLAAVGVIFVAIKSGITHH